MNGLYLLGILWIYYFNLYLSVDAQARNVGNGLYSVTNIRQCPGAEKYPFKIDVKMRKINRTHDGLNLNFDVPFTMDRQVGISVNVCKEVYGGCKPFWQIVDPYYQNFFEFYAANISEEAFRLAGMPPPFEPVPPGHYELKQYPIDYNELPRTALYGHFQSTVNFVKHFKKISCFIVESEFNPVEEYED